MENIIVGLIIAGAGAFALYRLVFRPGCACSSGCSCEKKGRDKPASECCSGNSGCGCSCGGGK